MKWMQRCLLALLSMTLFACGSNSGSGSRPGPQNPGFKVFGQCIPEKQLAAGIVRGEVVAPGAVDDKAAVLVLIGNSICTASPIADDVLLTAAHCLGNSHERVMAVFYPSLSCESGYNPTKHSIKARKIVKHLGYDEGIEEVERRTDDIGLIFLESKIPQGYPIYKIADENRLTNSTEMQVYGYGIVGETQGGKGYLRKATVAPQNFAIDQGVKKVIVDQSQGSGICMGDSGGPTFVTIDGERKVLGVNSYVFGPKGDICNKYSFQTLVNSYASWLDLQIQADRAETK